MPRTLPALAVALLAAVGCGGSPLAPFDAQPPFNDAADALAVDTATPDAAPPSDVQLADAGAPDVAVCTAPTGATCVAEGCTFAALELPTCPADAPPLEFYGPSYCGARLTVVNLVATWSVTCQNQAPELEAMVTQPLAARGVRVITVVAKHLDGGPPTATDCRTWQARWPQTELVTYDPGAVTENFYPPGPGDATTFPVLLIVDRAGVIRYSAHGNATSIAALRARLDVLLQ